MMNRKEIENKEFNAIEIHKMYDDDSLLCDVITESEGVEIKREHNIGFVKEVWSEMFALTESEVKELRGISDEVDIVVE